MSSKYRGFTGGTDLRHVTHQRQPIRSSIELPAIDFVAFGIVAVRVQRGHDVISAWSAPPLAGARAYRAAVRDPN